MVGEDSPRPFDTVVYEESDRRVATILLDRPERKNAFNAALYADTAAALRKALDSQSVRVAVLGSTSENFSAGADVKEWASGRVGVPGSDPAGFLALVDALVAFDKPLVAAVEGYAIGIAATALLHCDFVVMADDARIRMPFVALSIAPEAASSYLLPVTVGPTLARKMLLKGEWVDARTLYEAGWVYDVAPSGKALECAVSLAEEIARFPGNVLRRIKKLLLESRKDDVAAARAREDAANAESFTQPEFAEAIRAFLEKRDPDYSNFA